jgi:hypothetical protein
VSHRWKVVLRDSSEVTIKLGAAGPSHETSQAREAGRDDFLGVPGEIELGMAVHRTVHTAQQLSQAYRWQPWESLRERQRTHANADDAAGSRMSRGRWSSGTGKDELSGRSILVYRSPHKIPQFRDSLPFVEEDGSLAGECS